MNRGVPTERLTQVKPEVLKEKKKEEEVKGRLVISNDQDNLLDC